MLCRINCPESSKPLSAQPLNRKCICRLMLVKRISLATIELTFWVALY